MMLHPERAPDAIPENSMALVGTGARLAKSTRTRYCLASLPIRVVHLSCLLVAQQTPQFRLFSTMRDALPT